MWGTTNSANKMFRTGVFYEHYKQFNIYFYLSYHLPWLISMHPLWEYCICRYLYTALLKSVLCSSSTRSILLPKEKKKNASITNLITNWTVFAMSLSRLCSWLPFFLPHPPDSILPRFAANAMVDPYFPHYVLLANEPDHTLSCTLSLCSSTKPSL